MKSVALAMAVALWAGAASAQVRWPGLHRVRPVAERDVRAGDAAMLQAELPDVFFAIGVIPEESLRSQDTLRELAYSHYQRARVHGVESAHVHAMLAEITQRQRDLPAARFHAERALTLAPEGADAPGAWFTLSVVDSLSARHAEARTDYLQELRFPIVDGRRGVAFANLAETYVSLRDLPSAIDAYERALRATPDYELGWLGLALTLDRHGDSPWMAGRQAHEVAASMTQALSRRAGVLGLPLLRRLESDGVFFIPAYEHHAHEAMVYEIGAWVLEHPTRTPASSEAAQAYRDRARLKWELYIAEAHPDDPWRAHAVRHVEALRPAAAPRRR